MKSQRAIWLKSIIFSLFPALCTWLNQSNLLSIMQKKQYIGDSVNILELKDIVSFLGVFLTFVFLTRPLIITGCNEQKYHQQRDRLIKNNKDIFLKILGKTLGKENCDFNIRIFVPEKKFLSKLYCLSKNQPPIYFCIKNLEGLADAGITSKLKFKVFPEQEGLVGDCYKKLTILYDDDLENNNEVKYNMNAFQINKTCDLKFILVCPIIGYNNKIEAIVAFDSKTKIKVAEEDKKQLTTIVLNYTQELNELVPEFFR